MIKKINQYKMLFRSDKLGTIGLILTNVRRRIVYLLYAPLNWLLLMKGCQLRGLVLFQGKTIVSRFPNSQIIIGKGCQFVSSSYGNYRGIGHKCIISTGAEGAKIEIGDNCGFSGCSIVANKLVKIGSHVTVGADTIIGDRDDHPDIYPSEPKPVIIEDHVWIGMHCIVLKGVRIGKNSIIGAGSVVTKDIPENSIAAGVPCKVIKKRNED